MADKPTITIGTTQLKLQTGLQLTDTQWRDLAHIRAFDSNGEEITDHIQIDTSQLDDTKPGVYQLQALVSDPNTGGIAAKTFSVKLLNLEDDDTKAQDNVNNTPVMTEKPAEAVSKAEPKSSNKQTIAPQATTDKGGKSPKKKKTHHFLWSLLAIILMILVIWLLLHIFNGNQNQQSNTTSQSTSSSVSSDSSSSASSSDSSLSNLANEVSQLKQMVTELKEAVGDYQSNNNTQAYQSRVNDLQNQLNQLAQQNSSNNSALSKVIQQMQQTLQSMAQVSTPSQAQAGYDKGASNALDTLKSLVP